ncbi:MAG: S8 family serine peptidase [Edaphocola sp.]
MRKICPLILLLATTFPSLFAQEKPSGSKHSINFTANKIANLPNVLAARKEGKMLVMLQGGKLPPEAELAKNGIHLQDHISGYLHTAVITRGFNADVLRDYGIQYWDTVSAANKISTAIDLAKNNDILVCVEKGLGKTEVAAILATQGLALAVEQRWAKRDLWRTKANGLAIQKLANAGSVRFIGPYMEAQPLNTPTIGRTDIEPAKAPISLGGYGLTGIGVTVGVGDSGDPDHVDMIDRITSFNPIADNFHSNLTSGIVGGNGNKDQSYAGAATEVHLVEDYFSQILSNGDTYHQDFDMMLSNNSYGNVVGNCSYAGTYDLYSQYCDQQLMDNPQLLTVFASGNDGSNTCSPFPSGYATVLGAYQTAKNVLTVGAAVKVPGITEANFSSKGPTKDGRLKPEITGVGRDVTSSSNYQGYAQASGTSLSCPNVAGGAALLYQRYRQLHSGQNPTGALIKNILMNGADDDGQPGPDYIYGFGIMNLVNSLTMLDSNRLFSNTISTGQTQTYTITVPANTSVAKIMLYWNDDAASPSSTTQLINDLDLTVVNTSNTTLLPLVPNPATNQVANAATATTDHLNNVEQVTIDNPTAGTYTIKVNGYNVPQTSQAYTISYSLIPEGVRMKYPFGGEALPSGNDIYIYWDATANSNTFTLQYSTDNGSTWTTISSNIADTVRAYVWTPPSTIASAQVKIRVARNNTSMSAQSGAFTLLGRPTSVLSTSQCPGSIKMEWSAVTGASKYGLYKKAGPSMQLVDSTNDLSYTYTGLHTDSSYWVAVAPVIGNASGMRSIALSRTPNDGDCSGTASHGDLRLASMLSPQSGRELTSTSLTASTPLTISIGNQDNQAASQYRISYKINSGTWQSIVYTNSIGAAASTQLTVANLNLASIGAYEITVAVTNLSVNDPINTNDTFTTTVHQLSNDPINLTSDLVDTFETSTAGSIIGKSVTGLPGLDRWDFSCSRTRGRISDYLNTALTIQGQKSICLDNNGNEENYIDSSSYNTFTGTFNLAAYAGTSDEIRCEFDYVMVGVPKFDTGNAVWIRGKDTDDWIQLSTYQIDTSNLGILYHSGSVSISDLLRNNNQDFSTSTQIRFTQYDTSRIEATYFGNGLILDNFKIYRVTNDAMLVNIDSIYHYNCGLSNAVPIRISVANGVNNTIYNVETYCQLDNGTVISGLIDSIAGKDTIQYTFNQTLDFSNGLDHTLSAWVYLATDTYRVNDSLLNMAVRNQPVIGSFPYLQRFEENDGDFYTGGKNTSWAYGTPASPNIDHAASGSHVWKTNLSGNYNPYEVSYLYSPCFNVSQLNNPVLSFHMASSIEEPGSSIFDIAFVEYTNDGHNWQKLGSSGDGTNWYNNVSAQAWTGEDKTWWQAVTIPIPKTGSTFSFRIVLQSDQGAEYEGIAIDDIHVYDLVNPIFIGNQFAATITQNVSANTQVNYISDSNIALSVLEGNNGLGNVSVQDYGHTTFVNNDSTQYYLPRNFVVQSGNALTSGVPFRFYVPESAMATLRYDETCPSCYPTKEVQQLGVTIYKDDDAQKENNTLADNTNGNYQFITKENLVWTPYDVGYYTDVTLPGYGEYWFNNGGPTADQPVNQPLFSFNASHLGNRYALLEWQAAFDTAISYYQLERASEDMVFSTVATISGNQQNWLAYTYVDTPSLSSSLVHYRVHYYLNNGNDGLSVLRTLDWNGQEPSINIYPNPVQNGLLNLSWFKGNDEAIQWTLYTISGQHIRSGRIETTPYQGTATLDINSFAITKGLYLLKVTIGNKKWVFKVVYLQ